MSLTSSLGLPVSSASCRGMVQELAGSEGWDLSLPVKAGLSSNMQEVGGGGVGKGEEEERGKELCGSSHLK